MASITVEMIVESDSNASPITVETQEPQIERVTVETQLAINTTEQGMCPDLLAIYRSASL